MKQYKEFNSKSSKSVRVHDGCLSTVGRQHAQRCAGVSAVSAARWRGTVLSVVPPYESRKEKKSGSTEIKSNSKINYLKSS